MPPAWQAVRALAEIIEGKCRQADREPRHLDRAPAEMAEIGIERLGAGDHEEHGAKSEQPDIAVA